MNHMLFLTLLLVFRFVISRGGDTNIPNRFGADIILGVIGSRVREALAKPKPHTLVINN